MASCEVVDEDTPGLSRAARNVNLLDLDLPWMESLGHLRENAMMIACPGNRHALGGLELERRPCRPPLQLASAFAQIGPILDIHIDALRGTSPFVERSPLPS